MKLHDYDFYLIAFSGGKDSMAVVLWLLEQGVDRSKIELHHHLVDGREGSTLMDWPVTEDYCHKFAQALDIPIYFSWKAGGFEAEMLRDDQPTAPMVWESPLWNGGIETITLGGHGPKGTRKKYPQVSPDLSVRWCSAYLKIDVLRRLIVNSDRFRGRKTLVLSGERAEESKARSCYLDFEPDKCDNRNGKKVYRKVDRLRPIHKWSEARVWEIIERHRVRVHPCYYMGWSRCSCRGCIFGGCNQFRSLQEINPAGFAKLAAYEQQFGKTMKRNESLPALASKGTPYAAITPEMAALAMGTKYDLDIIIPADEPWELPAGAYGDSTGPQ